MVSHPSLATDFAGEACSIPASLSYYTLFSIKVKMLQGRRVYVCREMIFRLGSSGIRPPCVHGNHIDRKALRCCRIFVPSDSVSPTDLIKLPDEYKVTLLLYCSC